MPRPQPLTRSKGAKVFIFSVPGVGKTRLIGNNCPKTLIIRPPSGNTDSIDSPGEVEEAIVEDWSGWYELYQWGQQGGFADYEWVWIDDLSILQDHLLDDVLADAITRKPDRAVEKGGTKVPEYGPDKGEYKINMERLNAAIRNMAGLADQGMFNFGVATHIMEVYDPVAQEDVWAPLVQGKNMSPKLQGYFNIVAYLRKAEGRNGSVRILTTDMPGFVGRDQFDCFPELKSGKHGIKEPTMAKLIKAIEDKRGARTTKKKSSAKRSTKRGARRVARRPR